MTRLLALSTLIVLVVPLVCGQNTGILQCPRCQDPYDHTTCTETQTCHNTHDICEMHVHLADRNRIEFVCINSHACVNHEGMTCSATTHEQCNHCCRDLASCETLRQQLFNTVYTTMAPSDVTMAPSNVTMANNNMTSPNGTTPMTF